MRADGGRGRSAAREGMAAERARGVGRDIELMEAEAEAGPVESLGVSVRVRTRGRKKKENKA